MNYKEIIESRYNREAWQKLLHDIFGNKASFLEAPSTVEVESQLAKEVRNLGKITLSDGNVIAVYEVELADRVRIERNRTGIRNMLTTDWRNRGCAGAFMFCYRDEESILRFSYVSEIWGFNGKGEYKLVSTDTKRYTYLLGEGRACHTAIKQFTALRNSRQALSDVTTAFSVEALTKEFYKELFEWYEWAIDPKTQITFPNNTAIEDDDRDDLETKVIRMITRIMFVWFIKQKRLVPNNIFDTSFLTQILKDFDPQSATEGNYYNAILQNLFFATLNRAIKDEEGKIRSFATASKRDIKSLYRYAEMFTISEQEVIKLFAEVPFLNGGLFECLDKTRTIDGVKQSYNFDGFSRNGERFADGRFKHRAVVPNVLFFDPEKGLFPILSRYNFTIEENSPQDQQVALDPELLGKIFENLLGAYNPETSKTARKESGSFYTPRQIVDYMVNESLRAYLGSSPIVDSLLDDRFEYDATESSQYIKLAERLKAIKILDPACGSGAYPMGILNRLVHLLKQLEPYANIYELKLYIIENCIYGSDIQSIAVQISKLRFFISLICDCEPDANKSNFGIPTLPNLETTFVAANSLIALHNREAKAYIGGKLIENACDSNLFGKEIEELRDQIINIRHRHFSAKTFYAKRKLRDKDKALRNELAKELQKESSIPPEDVKQLVSWDPYDQNAVAPFFDPEWMLGVRDGFDIVIGNPPYIRLQDLAKKVNTLYKGCGFQTYVGKGDIYCLFYERGYQLLKKGGHLCYITSNKWLRAGYGVKTRGFLADHTDPKLLIDFGGIKIFENATINNNILLFCNGENQHKCCSVSSSTIDQHSLSNLSYFVEQHHIIADFSTSDAWIILSPIDASIKRKIEAVGTPLKEWNIQINYGIKTGCNDAFVIDTAKRDEILANCESEEERQRTEALIRPILRGRDIKRYSYDWAGLWLIATFPSRHYDIEQYPSVKQYLLSFGKERLEQTGKVYLVGEEKVKSRKKTNNKWFETQDTIAYWEDFDKPKIIWKRVGSRLRFAYVNHSVLSLDSTCFATGENIDFICCLLNSPMGHYLLKDSPQTGTGDLLISVQAIEPIKVPHLSGGEFVQLFSVLRDGFSISAKQETELNDIIFDMYHLSSEERKYILDNFNPLK